LAPLKIRLHYPATDNILAGSGTEAG